jgi:hypothetical protein
MSGSYGFTCKLDAAETGMFMRLRMLLLTQFATGSAPSPAIRRAGGEAE